jgi:hypothetical protein
MPPPSRLDDIDLAPAHPADRYDRLDAWRGIAIVWMACFHFAFDLNLPESPVPPPHQNFFVDPYWTTQRFCIVSMFLLGAGAGPGGAIDLGQTWRRFWRRWTQVAACAVLVSLGSALMFPHSWISFGVLHGVAVMLRAPAPARLALAARARSRARPRPSRRWRCSGGGVAAAALRARPFFNSRCDRTGSASSRACPSRRTSCPCCRGSG